MIEREMPAYFGGALWANHSLINPFGLLVLVLALGAILLMPRRRMILPVLLVAVFMPSALRIAVFSLDFTLLRIVILVTLACAALRGHLHSVRFTTPDKLLLLWTLWGIIAYGFLTGGFGGVITGIGGAIDTAGAYLIGRTYIRSVADMRKLFNWLALISMPMLLFFLVERTTGHNVFTLFGGVPEKLIVRNGELRCQGPFSHPILAGVFWATLIPGLIALWMGKLGSRIKIALALLCAFLIVVFTASSTSLMAALLGLLVLPMYVFRYRLRLIFLGAATALIALQLVMKHPIWHLMARIDLSHGSTGWHRYNLIQQAINHFNEWWLVGTNSTAHWGWGLQDITNQYVLEGVSGGILHLLLFVMFLACVFLRLGRSLRLTSDAAETWIVWGVGASLFVHCVSFLAVSYFGQVVELFYLFIGGAVSMTTVQRYAPRYDAEPVPAPGKISLHGAG
ncbi:hypothetical protein [Microbulbifer sp. SAOS-129_SWC]|uniref:hypothetical protein n=1 Tax=Microbulbifer sp. SAOS-129_SWC TaxID=3145235 RepID=UPI0032178F04